MSVAMPDSEPDLIPPEHRLALAHSARGQRDRLGVFLALDRRLGQFVSQSKEPMLTQMRLAWWRDQLGKPVAERPTGDATLDMLSTTWAGEEAVLITLVNGWEALLAEPPLPQEAALEFAGGRAACFAAMARLAGAPDNAASHYGVLWAFGDLAAKTSSTEERDFVLDMAAQQCGKPPALPYRLRSLSILGMLGQRVIQRREGPLIKGRDDIAIVMRLGLFGR